MNALPLLVLALLAPAPQGPSVKDLFDANLGRLRMSQQKDGSYGTEASTAHAVIAMSLSPRAYREDDGPFVRDAVAFLIQATQEEPGDPATDAVTALALQCVAGDRYAERIQALAARAGVPKNAIEQLAQTGELAADLSADPEWARDLPLPPPGADVAAVFAALPEQVYVPDRAEFSARAALALRRSKAGGVAGPDLVALIEVGVDYLLAQRGKSGMWEVFGRPEPGISALAAKALFASGRKEVREAAWPVLDWLKTLQKKDGSIHDGHLPVYVTSVAIGALAAGGRPEDKQVVARAAGFLRLIQADEGEGYSEADKFYGGIGYGSDLRPDLSNLQYALEALRDAGVSAEDPAFQRALKFLQRSQNRSESNPETFHDAGDPRPVRAGNDGGAVYYPGNSPAGMIELPDGSLVARSYGSMTYALLKCYFLVGLDMEDPRVKAAAEWIERHWTLEVNPGFDTLRDPRAGFQGLYYYYLSLAESLDSAGIDRLHTPEGVEHDWRAELGARLATLQREDGSWVNEMASRWWEGNPVLCTAYALNTLEVLRR